MSSHKGYLGGRRWTPVELAGLGHDHGWRDIELVEFVAVTLSESAGYERAHCFNFHGDDLTDMYAEDVGLMEISRMVTEEIPHDDELWDPNVNVARGRKLYEARGWQPWHGFTGFIATNPAMAGEYIQRSIWGVANFQRSLFGVKQIPYPKTGSQLRALLDKLTAKGHPVVPPFQSRSLALRPE